MVWTPHTVEGQQNRQEYDKEEEREEYASAGDP